MGPRLVRSTERPDRIALVTGAGTGIGRASAIALADAGFLLVLAGRRQAPLDEVAACITQAGSRALAQACDVSDARAVEQLFDRIRTEFGRLDLLFNNAGRSAPPLPLEELDIGVWRGVVEVNLTATFLCTQQAFRIMKAQDPRGGRIINNGSISAHSPRPFSAAYTATKHAVTGLTKATALDGRAYDIACGQIDIGNAATSAVQRMAAGTRQADGSIRPEPTINLAEVAAAVSFMAGLPPGANVQFMTVMPTAMPFVGRG